MGFLKNLIGTLAFVSLAALMISDEVIMAVPLLAFSSMSLGIKLGEKMNGARK